MDMHMPRNKSQHTTFTLDRRHPSNINQCRQRAGNMKYFGHGPVDLVQGEDRLQRQAGLRVQLLQSLAA